MKQEFAPEIVEQTGVLLSNLSALLLKSSRGNDGLRVLEILRTARGLLEPFEDEAA